MNTLFYFVNIGLPLLLILATFLFSFYFEQRILNKLQKIANRTGWSNNEFFFKSFRGIFILWFVLLGIWSATFLLPLSPQGNRFFQKFLLATFLGSGTLLFSRLAVSLIKFYGSREEGSPLTSLFENLTRLIVFSLGILIILQSVGIAITPLLTALGVGGVSIGLALQNTLANLFSGLNIITSKKVRPGDYIKLETGEEGYVRDIAWRYTIIREYYDNLIVIPNSK
ncbi:MAG: mechanosensitive ion channel, partial [Oscillatoria sp. PMC 1076.18]|nr:mechanosensitive ion channel [Oscillatoria sp. PMC 1076.18]